MKLIFAVAVCIVAYGANAGAQQSSSAQKAANQGSQVVCPMHDAHSQMNERGEKGMGFSQAATTHHFFLKPNGGVIRVEVNDSTNVDGRKSVRMHLAHIAGDKSLFPRLIKPLFTQSTNFCVSRLKSTRLATRWKFAKSPRA